MGGWRRVVAQGVRLSPLTYHVSRAGLRHRLRNMHEARMVCSSSSDYHKSFLFRKVSTSTYFNTSGNLRKGKVFCVR